MEVGDALLTGAVGARLGRQPNERHRRALVVARVARRRAQIPLMRAVRARHVGRRPLQPPPRHEPAERRGAPCRALLWHDEEKAAVGAPALLALWDRLLDREALQPLQLLDRQLPLAPVALDPLGQRLRDGRPCRPQRLRRPRLERRWHQALRPRPMDPPACIGQRLSVKGLRFKLLRAAWRQQQRCVRRCDEGGAAGAVHGAANALREHLRRLISDRLAHV
mmetsp:Transcript_7176/g.16970  ORF Transcript_7176/g.16970 Transcript_7176/m.16970 type:complete len:222 (-) Transcript_7176:434-1099(-)